jgi:hypothetical protein
MIYVKRYRGQERWIKCFFWPYGSYPRRDGKTPLSSYPHLRRFHAPEKRFLQAKASPSRLLSCPTRPRPLEKGEGHHLFRDQERVSIAEREAEKNRRSLQDIQQQVTLVAVHDNGLQVHKTERLSTRGRNHQHPKQRERIYAGSACPGGDVQRSLDIAGPRFKTIQGSAKTSKQSPVPGGPNVPMGESRTGFATSSAD